THAPSDITPVWTYGQGDIVGGDVAEAEELVLASKPGGKEVMALDANDGKERWTFTDSAMKIFLYAPVYADGMAYVTSYDQPTGDEFLVYALDAKTGRQIWHNNRFGIEVPQYRSGMLIGTTADKKYLALDAKTGAEVFSISVADEDWKKAHKGQEI